MEVVKEGDGGPCASLKSPCSSVSPVSGPFRTASALLKSARRPSLNNAWRLFVRHWANRRLYGAVLASNGPLLEPCRPTLPGRSVTLLRRSIRSVIYFHIFSHLSLASNYGLLFIVRHHGFRYAATSRNSPSPYAFPSGQFICVKGPRSSSATAVPTLLLPCAPLGYPLHFRLLAMIRKEKTCGATLRGGESRRFRHITLR